MKNIIITVLACALWISTIYYQTSLDYAEQHNTRLEQRRYDEVVNVLWLYDREVRWKVSFENKYKSCMKRG